jgi:hypothetical protein
MRFFRQKKLLTFLISASSLLVFTTGAVASEDAVYVEKGSPAPYSGVLLPLDKANELRKAVIELETLRATNSSYEKSVKLYQKSIQLSDLKVNMLTEQNEKLSQAVVESRSSGDLQKILWFGLGVIATGFALYGAKKATQ